MTQGLVMACLLHIPPADYSTITNKTSPPFAEALGRGLTGRAIRVHIGGSIPVSSGQPRSISTSAVALRCRLALGHQVLGDLGLAL